MADLTITPANVISGTGSLRETGTAGETVTQGQTVYPDPSTQKWLKADSNSATAAAHRSTAIALNAASLNQPLTVHKKGPITIGATLVPGTAYYCSETAGGIQPASDLGTGEEICQLGNAISSTVLDFDPKFIGVTL